MTKKKLNLILNTALIIFLSAACTTSGFDFKRQDDEIQSFCITKAKNSDEASILFWNWLMYQTRLTPKTAALHNIYQQDSAAFFYDLDGDGKREILGTHYSSALSGMGDCLLYILKYDEKNPSKYKKISDYIYFDAASPLYILEEKSTQYHKIKVHSADDNNIKYFSFDKRKNLYTEN